MKIYKITTEERRLRRRGEIQQPNVIYLSSNESLKKAIDIFPNIKSIEFIDVINEDEFNDFYVIGNPLA